MRSVARLVRPSSLVFATACRHKGDYGFNIFHNSNPQHGGSYARHERRMREDEVEDFLKSVKNWRPVYESTTSSLPEEEGEAPSPSPLQVGEEAIMRTFVFDTYRDAYLFMGRLWAFCYGSDKYPHVVWEGQSITVYLYSPSFRGLSKREARVAAFLNDQYNMKKKSMVQQQRFMEGVAKGAAVEEWVGAAVAKSVEAREAARRAPVREVSEAPTRWTDLLSSVASAVEEDKKAPLKK